jgi:hypothetical protein
MNKKNSRLPQIDYEENDGSFVINLEDQITLFKLENAVNFI